MPTVVLALLLWTGAARATTVVEAGCGDKTDLDKASFRGKLTDPQKACLERAITVVDPPEKVKASTWLIVDAWASGDQKDYPRLLERHLTQISSADADMAYLYAVWLSKQGDSRAEDVVRWCDVALANRGQWARDVREYRANVKVLYDLRNLAAMTRAVEAKHAYEASHAPEDEARALQTAKRARTYLAMSGPCLVNDDCGPDFTVEVSEDDDDVPADGAGAASGADAGCGDLGQLEAAAAKGTLPADAVACLETHVDPDGRAMSLLETNASFGRDDRAWTSLLAWRRGQTGEDDPELAVAYAVWLASGGPGEAEEARRWAQVAIDGADRVPLTRQRDVVGRAWELRAKASRQLADRAEADAKAQPSEEHAAALASARATAESDEQAAAAYCAEKGCPD